MSLYSARRNSRIEKRLKYQERQSGFGQFKSEISEFPSGVQHLINAVKAANRRSIPNGVQKRQEGQG